MGCDVDNNLVLARVSSEAALQVLEYFVSRFFERRIEGSRTVFREDRGGW